MASGGRPNLRRGPAVLSPRLRGVTSIPNSFSGVSGHRILVQSRLVRRSRAELAPPELGPRCVYHDFQVKVICTAMWGVLWEARNAK